MGDAPGKRVIRRYRERKGAHLSREPVYLTRKRGVFVRTSFTLSKTVMVTLRELVFQRGGTLSGNVERALRAYLNMPSKGDS